MAERTSCAIFRKCKAVVWLLIMLLLTCLLAGCSQGASESESSESAASSEVAQVESVDSQDEESIFSLDLTRYLNQEKEAVLADLDERGIPLDERTDPDDHRYGYYIVQEEIGGIQFATNIVFGQLEGWDEVRCCHIRSMSEKDASDSITPDKLNTLLNTLLELHGPIPELTVNVVTIRGYTYDLSDIQDEEVKEKFDEGCLFDLDVSYIHITWHTKEGGAATFMYNKDFDSQITLFIQSPEATDVIGYEYFQDPQP